MEGRYSLVLHLKGGGRDEDMVHQNWADMKLPEAACVQGIELRNKFDVSEICMRKK